MDTKNVILKLRTENGMSQEDLANKVFVTRQAVSRWENGETVPNTDTLKLLSELFGVSINTLIGEINDLKIAGMPKVEKLNALVGSYVNLAYRLPNGIMAKFLDDNATYLGNQLECEFGGDRCFGVLANMEFILVSTYGKNGEDPELLVYKKR